MNTDNPVIVHQGYYIDLFDNSAWLTQNGNVTIIFEDRGIWNDLDEAKRAYHLFANNDPQ